MQDPQTGGKLGNEVEVDETFIGGKARNMHADKRARKITGRGPSSLYSDALKSYEGLGKDFTIK